MQIQAFSSSIPKYGEQIRLILSANVCCEDKSITCELFRCKLVNTTKKPTSLCVFLPCALNEVKEKVLGVSAISKKKNGDGERVDNLILCFLAFQSLIF